MFEVFDCVYVIQLHFTKIGGLRQRQLFAEPGPTTGAKGRPEGAELKEAPENGALLSLPQHLPKFVEITGASAHELKNRDSA